MTDQDFEYIGFWARVWASIIDTDRRYNRQPLPQRDRGVTRRLSTPAAAGVVRMR